MTQPSGGILTFSSQSKTNPVTEYFKTVIRNSGIGLSSNDGPNLLTQEQALVVRDIEKALEAGDGNECIDRFLRGFKVLIRKEKYLKKALLPTLFNKQGNQNGAESDVEIQQESLFRILLKVNRLQNEIIEIILDQLTSTISDEEHDPSQLRLLLNQIRYLPHIKDPENMTTKLLDIIDVAPFPSQLEILDSIPEILPDSEYNETAKELAKMLDKSEDLSGAIIDCLNALNLSSEIRSEIQDHILSKMLTGTSTKTLPVFLDFLLTDCNARNLPGTLVKIRSALNNIMASQDKKDKEKESTKILIFNRLQKAATSKLVSESWLTVISGIKSHTDHKPVDLLILFMLHSSTKLKKRTIETTFRKRIKEGQFKCGLLEQFFEKYLLQQLLRDYFTTMVEIGSSLLRGSNQAVVTEFAATLFKLLFGHQYTERTFRQEILEHMIVLVGASDQKNVTAILKIILDLIPEIAKNPNHAIILMRLLEKLDSFELKDVKLVFEILCSLACSEESLLGLKEELHMIVRKRLSSSKRAFKHMGIISAVVMAKHIATTVDTANQSEISLSEDSILSINQLQGAAKEAAAILELTNTCTNDCPDLVGFYYDQLASMLRPTEILYDKSFLTWLHETVTNDFTAIFTTDTVCDDINDLQFSRQYNINSEEEIDTHLAVNVAELTLKSEKSSIVVLTPHFRLLRLLHHRQYNGDLSNINALLGCAVILPKTEQIDSLSSEQIKQTTDCLFHCINWFREVISGFVLQKNVKLRRKVIERLDNLYELEKLLNECLENIPEHKLPTSYFEALTQATRRGTSPAKEPTKPTKRPRKLLQAKRIEDTTVTASTSNLKSARKSKDEYHISFREMDTDVVKLLRYPLNSEEIISSDQTKLNINQLSFILKDYVTKLSLLTEGRDLGLLDLTTVTPTKFMTDVVTVLPHMNKHLVVIIKELSREDLDENSQEKNCFGLILESLSLIFNWTGFHHSKNLDLLRDILKAFPPEVTSTPLNSVNHLVIATLVNRIGDYTDHCSSLLHAVHLIKTMEALHSLAPNSTIRSKIAKTAGKLLNKDWQKQNSLNTDILIRSYLSSANIKSLCGMVGTLQDQAPTLRDKTDSLEMLKSVTKSNFYVFYRNLWSCLQDRVKTEVESLTNAEHLTLWHTTALTMQGLMTVAKAQETKLNLVCFLKKSIAILKLFLSHGIPILEIELKFEPDRVLDILKNIQANTRYLHHLCCFSKLTKDASLMAYVPQFRLTLETLIYRVKAALVANGCSAAFWMGNLRNRDLQGEDILTQSTESSSVNGDEEEEEDEEMPSDVDSDDDVEYARDKSGSPVYE